MSLRESSCFAGTTMPMTRPPASTAPRKTLNSDAFAHSSTPTSSSPNRMSGLSTPKRSIASLQAMRGNGVGSSTWSASRNVSASARSQAAKTSSSSTKDISMSSCVNSGWRSARRSSSRKQRATWK
jgi:hypothetical protein